MGCSLREKQIVEKLIRYLVEPPPEDADVKRRYKCAPNLPRLATPLNAERASGVADRCAHPRPAHRYPYYACEIFTCEIDGIFTTVFENSELLDLLFSLLERPSPLPPVLAGYFAKVVSSLLTRRTADCMLFLQVTALASHRSRLCALCAYTATAVRSPLHPGRVEACKA